MVPMVQEIQSHLVDQVDQETQDFLLVQLVLLAQ